jgi:hypothetical protein
MSSHVYVYLAGNHNAKTSFRVDFNELAKEFGIVGLDPFDRNVEFTSDNAVGRDLLLISHSDYVICECSEGGNMSTGTAMEAVIAKSLGKVVIALSPERCEYFPSEGIHPFTWKFTDKVVSSVEEALEFILEDIQSGNPSRTLEEQIEEFAWTEFPEGDVTPF